MKKTRPHLLSPYCEPGTHKHFHSHYSNRCGSTIHPHFIGRKVRLKTASPKSYGQPGLISKPL